MIMPFGKYRGECLTDIPLDYLLWLEGRDLWPDLREAVVEEIQRRQGYDSNRSIMSPENVLRLWYRKASLRLHPDRENGDTRAMQVVNACREILADILEASR